MPILTVDQIESQRRRLMIAFLLSYLAWRVMAIASQWLTTAMPPEWADGLKALSVVPALVWFWYAFRLFHLMRTISSDERLSQALNDERVRTARFRAAAAGLLALLITLVIMRLALLRWPSLPGGLLIDLLLLIGVVAAVAAFVIYDRD